MKIDIYENRYLQKQKPTIPGCQTAQFGGQIIGSTIKLA
jgi:hypothetical protein